MNLLVIVNTLSIAHLVNDDTADDDNDVRHLYRGCFATVTFATLATRWLVQPLSNEANDGLGMVGILVTTCQPAVTFGKPPIRAVVSGKVSRVP